MQFPIKALSASVPTALIVLCTVSACGDDSESTHQLQAEADSIAAAYAADGRWNGGLLVANGTSVHFLAASGLADRQTNRANTPDMPYDLFSISKSFTAIAVLQLQESGQLTVDDVLSDHLPEYAGPGADRITIHQLLSHTSGVPDYLSLIPGYWDDPPSLTRDSVLQIVAAHSLEFEPGEGFGYSNSGYVLLSKVIETVTGDAFEEILRMGVFEPAGMSETYWTSTPAEAQNIATGYRGEEPAPVEVVQKGEAGIVSTLADMHRFALALGTEALLTADSWERAFTQHGDTSLAQRFHPAHFAPHGYGFSLPTVELADGTIVRLAEHGGAGSGGTAMMQRVIDGDGIVLFWNNDSDIVPYLPEVLSLVAEQHQ